MEEAASGYCFVADPISALPRHAIDGVRAERRELGEA